nr:MAG TPA: hypothetical protein [Caudoviricetes sp.]
MASVFSRYNLLFSKSFLYALILINLFIIVKKFANFLDNILKKEVGDEVFRISN